MGTLDKCQVIQGPSGQEIDQIWANIAEKLAEISKIPTLVKKWIPNHLQWPWMVLKIDIDVQFWSGFNGIKGPLG